MSEYKLILDVVRSNMKSIEIDDKDSHSIVKSNGIVLMTITDLGDLVAIESPIRLTPQANSYSIFIDYENRSILVDTIARIRSCLNHYKSFINNCKTSGSLEGNLYKGLVKFETSSIRFRLFDSFWDFSIGLNSETDFSEIKKSKLLLSDLENFISVHIYYLGSGLENDPVFTN